MNMAHKDVSSDKPGGRNRSLDGLRGLAAFSVGVGHSITHLTGTVFYSNTVFEFGSMHAWQIVLRIGSSIFNADAAVILFFVLSGHVLARSLEGKRPSAIYFVRRAFRLVPTGIIAAIPFVWFFRPDLLHAIGTALLMDRSVNGVIWSLQVEWLGSILIFLLAYLGGRHIALGVAVASLWFGLSSTWWQALFLPAFCLGFLVPALPVKIARSRMLAAAALAVYLFADLACPPSAYLIAIRMAAAFLLVAHLSARPGRLMQSRPIGFMGDISYPFYLIHTFVLMKCAITLGQSGSAIIASVSLTCAMFLPIAALVAWGIHKTVEMPGVALGNRLLMKVQRQPVHISQRGRRAQM